MAERLLLDSDVLIEYLRGQREAVEYLEGTTSDLYVSVISVAELFAGVRGNEEEVSLKQSLLAFTGPSPKKWRAWEASTGGTSDLVIAPDWPTL